MSLPSDAAGAEPSRAAVTGAPPLGIAVAGASGRMGRMLIEALVAADDLQFCGALDVEGSASLIWGTSDIATQRTGIGGRLLSGETSAESLSFDIEAERWIATQQPGVTWAPYAGLSYTSARRDGFTETGDRLEAFEVKFK